MPGKRTPGPAVAAAGVALVLAGLALAFHTASVWPADWPERGLALGPPPARLVEQARSEIDRAALALEEQAVPIEQRIAEYRRRLRAADRLLVRSLRANPAQPWALAYLAVVRWELRPPASEDDIGEHLARIEAASRMAPGIPGVQQRLGELLLLMGRRDQAATYIRRALSLDPDRASEVIDAIRPHYPDPVSMLEVLPPQPAVLWAAQKLFHDARSAGPFLEVLERCGLTSDIRLLRAYGTVCLVSGQAERLEERMSGLGTLNDTDLEAERLLHRSRARSALGRARPALADAREARRLVPEGFRFAVNLGTVALEIGRPDEAVTAFRDALDLAARDGAPSRVRARIYREIGRAEEATGRPDRAFDAYNRALDLDPDERLAARRIAVLEAASGAVPGERP